MFVDPNNPFAAPTPKKGSVPNPFGPDEGGKAPSGNQPERIPSPFETPPKSREKSVVRPSQNEALPESPFALVDHKLAKPDLSEPLDGFALPDSVPEPEEPPPVALSQPKSRDDLTLEDDPFALPTPQNRARASQEPELLVSEEVTVVESDTGGVQGGFSQVTSVAMEMPEAQIPPVQTVNQNEMPQLVLRAIFGVAEEMNRDEILRRARSLPGIRHLQLAGPGEVEGMAMVRSGVQRMGFGDPNKVSIHTEAGILDVIEEPGVSLAVLRENDYGAGVRETLIIVARELARLG